MQISSMFALNLTVRAVSLSVVVNGKCKTYDSQFLSMLTAYSTSPHVSFALDERNSEVFLWLILIIPLIF